MKNTKYLMKYDEVQGNCLGVTTTPLTDRLPMKNICSNKQTVPLLIVTSSLPPMSLFRQVVSSCVCAYVHIFILPVAITMNCQTQLNVDKKCSWSN